jgi:hypothetical protein
MFKFKDANPRERLASLQDQLPAATTAIETARAAVVAAIGEGASTAVVEAAEAAAWKAELHARSLEKVIEALGAEIAEADEKARQAADKKEREATSRAFHAKADKFEKTLAPLLAALKEAGAAAADLTIPFATNEGFSTLCRKLAEELPASHAELVAEQRQRALDTLAGRAPASLPAPFIPVVVSAQAPTVTVEVFALERLQWSERHGVTPAHIAAQSIGRLPAALVESAFKRNLAYKLDDPRYLAMREQAMKTGWPHLSSAAKTYDLDRDPNAVTVYRDGRKVQTEAASLFQEIDRGPPRKVLVQGPADFENFKLGDF